MTGDAELKNAERRWLSGGSALPAVTLLLARASNARAAAVARLALSRPDCPDAAELEAVLARLAAFPGGWKEALAEFAKNPCLAKWHELMRFVPPEYAYQRQRETVRVLRLLGVSGDLLFICASEYGLIPELIELVEDGEVAVSTLVERAERSGGARTTYLGLAAVAAFSKGDMFNSVRLLRESVSYENEWCTALPHIVFIRERASIEQNQLLDRAGIPAV